MKEQLSGKGMGWHKTEAVKERGRADYTIWRNGMYDIKHIMRLTTRQDCLNDW